MLASIAIVVLVAAGSLAGVLAGGWHPQLGLDLDGGLSVLYQPTRHASQSDLDETVNILSNRVDALGVSGASVGTQGNDIAVSIPGVKDPQTILNTIGKTAQLYFRPVLCYAPAPNATAKAAAKKAQQKGGSLPALPSNCASSYQLVTSNLSGSASSSSGVSYQIPPDPSLAAYPTSTTDNPKATVLQGGLPGSGGVRYLEGPAQLTGRAVKTALAQQSQVGAWVVNISLTGAGSTGWDKMTQQYFHEIIGIELDGVVQSAPITQPSQTSWTSFDGSVEISGNFTQSSAQSLAVALQFGSLPVPLKPIDTQTVSPTLGRSALDAGLYAGLAGLALVLLYVLAYYRALGLVVISGLAVTAALLWAVVSLLGHSNGLTLDLAGVTGLIVSIGITVDSYIVYFERLKDEARAGRTIRTSVDRSFASAWRTVLAADLVSLLGALLLYFIAVGEVRGFAFFLGLSTLLDVIVTYFYTRPLVIVLGRNERLTNARHFGISRGLAMPEPVGADAR
ncbi:MAG TPA: protein translocase subunit SecD [Acidimicrobiales bacterium]